MRRLHWVGTSLDDLRDLPDPVQDEIGHALYQVQTNRKPARVKALKGFKGAGVLEIIEDYDGEAYRAVYTVKLASAVYVLHVFHKKSKRGSETPRGDMELIRQRLKEAEKIEKDQSP